MRIISMLLYIISLTLPCFSLGTYSGEDYYGGLLLLLGGFVMLDDPIGLIWLANPLIWFAWFQSKLAIHSLITSLMATSVVVLFLAFDMAPNYGWCGSFLEPEDCPHMTIRNIGPGYIFWLFSAIVLVVGNLMTIPAKTIFIHLFRRSASLK